VDGKALGTHILEVAAAHPEGGQATYKWANPTTGQVEPKVSVVRAVGEDVCGVGAYSSEPGS
jgi:signal transduction histidine kinase